MGVDENEKKEEGSEKGDRGTISVITKKRQRNGEEKTHIFTKINYKKNNIIIINLKGK